AVPLHHRLESGFLLRGSHPASQLLVREAALVLLYLSPAALELSLVALLFQRAEVAIEFHYPLVDALDRALDLGVEETAQLGMGEWHRRSFPSDPGRDRDRVVEFDFPFCSLPAPRIDSRGADFFTSAPYASAGARSRGDDSPGPPTRSFFASGDDRGASLCSRRRGSRPTAPSRRASRRRRERCKSRIDRRRFARRSRPYPPRCRPLCKP